MRGIGIDLVKDKIRQTDKTDSQKERKKKKEKPA